MRSVEALSVWTITCRNFGIAKWRRHRHKLRSSF